MKNNYCYINPLYMPKIFFYNNLLEGFTLKKRDINQINEKIDKGEANIYTAEEFKKLIKEDNANMSLIVISITQNERITSLKNK